MNKTSRCLFFIFVLMLIGVNCEAAKRQKVNLWPDGTPIDAWFSDTTKVDVGTLGKQYVITDYGVIRDSMLLQTEAIQRVIDKVASNGGGVVVIPRGTFLTGSLFFKPGTHLHIIEGGVLKGIDAIKHYPLVMTRMEGQTLNYFAGFGRSSGLDGSSIRNAPTWKHCAHDWYISRIAKT